VYIEAKGSNLKPSSCCIVAQENNNFGLHKFFEGYLLSEEKPISLPAVIAVLC
jgi:hypothetical protein